MSPWFTSCDSASVCGQADHASARSSSACRSRPSASRPCPSRRGTPGPGFWLITSPCATVALASCDHLGLQPLLLEHQLGVLDGRRARRLRPRPGVFLSIAVVDLVVDQVAADAERSRARAGRAASARASGAGARLLVVGGRPVGGRRGRRRHDLARRSPSSAPRSRRRAGEHLGHRLLGPARDRGAARDRARGRRPSPRPRSSAGRDPSRARASRPRRGRARPRAGASTAGRGSCREVLHRDLDRRVAGERHAARSASRTARSRASRGRSAGRPACPRACSGERYCAVPTIEPASVICEAPERAIPKSVTLTFQSGLTITLCGLMSRWTISCRCASASALRISRANLIAVSGGRRPLADEQLLERRPVEVLHRDVVGALGLRRGRRSGRCADG